MKNEHLSEIFNMSMEVKGDFSDLEDLPQRFKVMPNLKFLQKAINLNLGSGVNDVQEMLANKLSLVKQVINDSLYFSNLNAYTFQDVFQNMRVPVRKLCFHGIPIPKDNLKSFKISDSLINASEGIFNALYITGKQNFTLL